MTCADQEPWIAQIRNRRDQHPLVPTVPVADAFVAPAFLRQGHATATGLDLSWGPPLALRMQRLAGNRAVTETLEVRERRRSAIVQRRRIPSAAQTDPLLAGPAANRFAHTAGLDRIIARAMAELSPAERGTVTASAHTIAGSAVAYGTLHPAEKARVLAAALRAFRPGLVLGDPALINTGPRNATDKANIATLVTNATALIGLAMAPAATTHLRDVFGASNVAAARARYAAASTRLGYLKTAGKIVTDRSGYNTEVGLGGLTNSARMSLSPGTIDTPGTDEATVLVLHESMHAGNPTVKDYGYLGTPGFTTLANNVKLDNAAHYEVPARRIKAMAHAYTGQVFVPAGTSVTVGGVVHTTAPLTPLEQASRDASEVTRAAWNMGLNMHSLWVRLNLNRSEWSTLDLPATYSGASAPHFADCMPYWSKVQALTVHLRPGLTASLFGSMSRAPVTQTDVALSEGLVRLVSKAKNMAKVELRTSATATAFLVAHATGPERAAASTAPTMKDLLLLCLCRAVGEMTGPPSRDARVIKEMAGHPTYVGMLTTRGPGAFP